jgi:hypothetical protein
VKYGMRHNAVERKNAYKYYFSQLGYNSVTTCMLSNDGLIEEQFQS